MKGVVSAAHTFASTTLLQLLVEDRDLIGHLKSVKKYFLIEQGDFEATPSFDRLHPGHKHGGFAANAVVPSSDAINGLGAGA